MDHGFDIVFGLVTESAAEPTSSAQSGIDYLKSKGVRFLQSVHLDPFPPPAPGWQYWAGVFTGSRRMLLRGWGQEGKIEDALRAFGDWSPDFVIPVWSYEATYAAAGLRAPLCLFHGNPDHKVLEAGYHIAWRWERSWNLRWLVRHLLGRLSIKMLELTHRRVLKNFPVIWENAWNDVGYYRSHHFENVRYLRNMWPAPEDDSCLQRRDAIEQTQPVKICGNLGHLGATANTYGLWALCEEIVPALTRKLGSDGFEVNIYGRTQPRAFLSDWLEHPNVRLRGFVDDVDSEVLSSPIFLLANNRYNFKVGHTRILTAFATGACIVAYRDTALSMPELVHGENILLGDSGEELAQLIAEAARNRDLRRRIGANGLRTLRALFSPRDSVATMAADMRSLANVPDIGPAEAA